MKLVSIIIPALNEENYLPRLLQSIASQKYAEEYEVIVVDGQSEDRTIEVAKSFQGAIKNLSVYSCERGTSRQRNFGVSKAKYDNIIFLDADTELSPGGLAKISAFCQKKQDFVAIPILYPYDGRWSDVFWCASAYVIFLFVWLLRRPVVSGMCIITTRQVHDQIGGFDVRAKYGEDIDYGLRAYKTGASYRILWRTLVRASGRRMYEAGRWTIAKLWLKWYIHIAWRGGIVGDQEKVYEYGRFGSKDE